MTESETPPAGEQGETGPRGSQGPAGPAGRVDWARYLLIYIALGVSALAVTIALTNKDNADDLKAGLIAGCEETREPLQNYFEGKIRQTDGAAVFFPDASPELKATLAEQVEMLKHLTEVFDPDDCAAQYED